MWAWVKKALTFLRVVDVHDGLVSLTSLALLVVLVKIALTPEPGLAELGSLFIGLLAYAAKKTQFSKTQRDDTSEQLEDLVSRVEKAEEKSNRVLNTIALKTSGR